MAPKRILVVDDEPQIVELLNLVLTGAGYDVDGAENAAEALALVRDRIFDAVILDFNLPDTTGLRLHHEIRQLDEELSANTLFISGLEQSDQNLEYYQTFGRGFLCKPFQPADVLNAIDALCRDGESGEDPFGL